MVNTVSLIALLEALRAQQEAATDAVTRYQMGLDGIPSVSRHWAGLVQNDTDGSKAIEQANSRLESSRQHMLGTLEVIKALTAEIDGAADPSSASNGEVLAQTGGSEPKAQSAGVDPSRWTGIYPLSERSAALRLAIPAARNATSTLRTVLEAQRLNDRTVFTELDYFEEKLEALSAAVDSNRDVARDVAAIEGSISRLFSASDNAIQSLLESPTILFVLMGALWGMGINVNNLFEGFLAGLAANFASKTKDL